MKTLNIALWYPTIVPAINEDEFFEKVSRLREHLLDIEGVYVVKDDEDAELDIDVLIILLDHCSPDFVNQVSVIKHCDMLLWCFIPRSTLPPVELSKSLNVEDRHRIYPYDCANDIIRMVARRAGSKAFTPVACGTMIECCVRHKLLHQLRSHKVFGAIPGNAINV